MKRSPSFKFRLYVAGHTENSEQALANLTKLCTKWLADRHEIEIVDVFKEPEKGLVDEIFMTPTLLILAPPPKRRIVGTLSHGKTVLQTLGIETVAA
jgi:circadian clock protein KaiB